MIDSLELVQANAEALMSCGAPEAAAVVLNRYLPRVGDERRQWLLLRWRAAAAALDHRQAALALRRLVDGNLKALDAPLFPGCLLYTSPSPRDYAASRMPSSA